jgi:hypothetical protein
MLPALLACMPLTIAAAFAPPHDPDSDGDGLSDFHERHKYFTNPESADSDGDGIADGEWDERREFTYSLRTVVQVLPPVTPEALSDDYQDARILDRTDSYVEVEVIHYPLNIVASTIVGDPNWRMTVQRGDLQPWIQPGLTANWDDPMREQIIAGLKADGIDADQLDDKTLVERASKWLLNRAKYVDGFTTFCSQFVDGQPRLYPGIEPSVTRGHDEKDAVMREHWQRELFARGMFQHRQRGSCTSSAIYLNGCLRALGIPTRIVLAIPVVDSSDEREVATLDRLQHHRVRGIIQQGAGSLGNAWSSHTFNEVFVGGRWRRLNYNNLGQNTLDPQFFGLMTHVATFNDWADGNMAENWGIRLSNGQARETFGGSNPYSTISMSDRFGAHANLENPADTREHRTLTIDRAYWFHERPGDFDMRLDDPDTAGHIVVHVVEGRAGEGPQQYKRFYDRVGKQFVLKADGHPDIPVHATRGYWAAPEQGLQHFYLRIEPDNFARMMNDVAYELHWIEAAGAHRWAVIPGVTLTKRAEGANAGRASTVPEAPEPPNGTPREITIDFIAWSDAPDSPTGPLPNLDRPVILARMGPGSDFPLHKRFTDLADLRFLLRADGHPTLKVGAGAGGITTSTDSYAVITLGAGDWLDLVEGVEYSLEARNDNKTCKWKLAAPLRIKR